MNTENVHKPEISGNFHADPVKRDVRLNIYIFRNFDPQIMQISDTVTRPTNKLPCVPKLLPVNGNHNGQARPTIIPLSIINNSRFLAFLRGSKEFVDKLFSLPFASVFSGLSIFWK